MPAPANETTQQKMDRLIEAYRRGEPVADELRTMPKEELKQLKGLLEKEKKKTSGEIAETRVKIRAEKAKLLVLQTDHKRMTKELITINQQLWSAFGEIFTNAETAVKAAYAYEQKHGVEAVNEMLKVNPHKFGRLKGVDLWVWKNTSRKQALHWLEVFSYSRMRTKYGQVHHAKHALDDTLKNTPLTEETV